MEGEITQNRFNPDISPQLRYYFLQLRRDNPTMDVHRAWSLAPRVHDIGQIITAIKGAGWDLSPIFHPGPITDGSM